MLLRAFTVLLAFVVTAQPLPADADADTLIAQAIAAEQALQSETALALFLQAEKARPDDPLLLQKIARQYSDSIVDLESKSEQRRYAEQALAYSQRAIDLDPDDPVNVLSRAVSRGKLALFSNTRTKIEYSRLIKTDAERAIALDPDYAWAHHVLGRWHREVATLGTVAQWYVGLVYGGLPEASVTAAVSQLERAVELEPDNLNHHLELGLAYQAAGRNDDARRALEYGLGLPSREKHDDVAKSRARRALADIG
ncbi:hypothetical protein [Synoicihabitans lomoniglobus]|uniref:Regulator of microtubule dynamics protein 1 n=1 Tax=Synoicihabitans lomoniglobus TaxID=2909285 RepID=A0AAE9ZW37_9BACT|nr:hypothetical protein [Opitutaceae bacterium LMO-M01]WED63955.1 hypothetical protein PXH66_16580 [Opitutaceae bacterium LMO-M01]